MRKPRAVVLIPVMGVALALIAGLLWMAARSASSAGLLPYRLFVPGLASDPAEPVGLRCGVERWDVKTLSNPAAGSVDFTPVNATVAGLRALTPPVVGDHSPRFGGLELTTYRVSAELVGFKLAEDRDIHLVIAQPGDLPATMIVELPDVACAGAISSAKKAEMAAARAAFEAACGTPTTSYRLLTGHATVTGVGFWDQIHGQTGVAPNGVELHPLLSFASANCGLANAACSGSATISALNKAGEVVTVSGTGTMTDWYLISERGNQRFDFPAGFVLSGSVQIRSAVPQFANTANTLWWTSANVWLDGGDDDAALYDCRGVRVSLFDDGQ